MAARPGLRALVRACRIALPVALLVAAWGVLAPAQLGGNASYVITSGTSMLPQFKADGLVVTRSERDLQVGDVVAYHNKQLGAVVMHRIVALDGQRFVLQGDNNDFLDQYRPTRADVVGEKWVYLPGVGAYLRKLRDPAVFGTIVGLIALFCLRITPVGRRRRHLHVA